MKAKILIIILLLILIGGIITMGIFHDRVVASRDKGLATDWNADHKVQGNLDFRNYAAVNMLLEGRNDWPAGPAEGRIIWRSDLKNLYIFDGTNWIPYDSPKRAATLIVAANNSLDKTRADYVCDGIDDYVEINQALAALPAVGGRVLLLEGTFDLYSDDINGVVTIDKNYTTLEGQGCGTVLFTDHTGSDQGTISLTNKTHVKLKNFRFNQQQPDDWWVFWGNGCDDLKVENIWFEGLSNIIEIYNMDRALFSNWVVNSSYLEWDLGTCTQIEAININIEDIGSRALNMDGVSDSIFSNIVGKNLDVRLRTNSDRTLIINNLVESITITDANCDHNVLHGNLTDVAIVDNGTNTHKADNWVF